MRKTLILTFEEAHKDVRTWAYRETLQYIMDNSPNTETHQFVDNKSLLEYVKSNEISIVVSTNEIPRDAAHILKGCEVVQILIGMRDDLLDVSDIVIDPLVSKSEKFLVGTRYLLPSIVEKFSAESLADIIGIDSDTLLEEANHNDAETELLEIVQLYKKLEWDSDFFGLNVGYLLCLRLTPNIEKHVKKFVREEKIDLLEYLCNCHDKESVVTSEKNGYSFVDIRLTFEHFLRDDMIKEPGKREGYSVRKGDAKDIEQLKKIATGIYKYSRYHFDDNFKIDKVIDFYLSWVGKAIYGKFDDYAYVLCHDHSVIGFCTIKKTRKNAARIGLVGMSSEYIGGGLAKHLLNMSLYKLKEEGVDYVEVVTQGRNYPAQRLYQKCGFLTKTTELWYHKWIH